MPTACTPSRDDNAAAANERLAQQVWDYYNAKYGDSERIDLPPMPSA